MKRALLFCMILIISGCATSPVNPLETKTKQFLVPENHLLLYLYRNSGWGGGSLVPCVITIDEQKTIVLNNGEYYVIELSLGIHKISGAFENFLGSSPFGDINFHAEVGVNWIDFSNPYYNANRRVIEFNRSPVEGFKKTIQEIPLIAYLDLSDPQVDLMYKQEKEEEEKNKQREEEAAELKKKVIEEQKVAEEGKAAAKQVAELKKKAAAKRTAIEKQKALKKQKAAEERGEYLPNEGLLETVNPTV